MGDLNNVAPLEVVNDNIKIAEVFSTSDQNEQNTHRKGHKRKGQNRIENTPKRFKEQSTEDCQSPSIISPAGNNERSSKRRMSVNPEELHNMLEGMEDEIDDALEHAASKNKLTRTNVKNILKHVITNEYVLAMVRNTMKIENGEGDLEEAVYEPKLTRSKAKELLKNQYTLPWAVPSPMKKGEQATQKLLEEEFPDESSDDEDYKPNEEEEHSDDEDRATSPRTSEMLSPRTPIIEQSPPPFEEILEEYAEDDNNLIIALPDLNPPSETSEADKIALRTRSKLCLNDTPLEEIEASFFAPDITVDMYDTVCDDDDWSKFICDFIKPLDTDVMTEQVGEDDDVEDDPEYNAQEDDDAPDPLDLTFDQTTRIPRNELNALMAEILEFAQQEYMDDEEDDEHIATNAEQANSVFTNLGGDSCVSSSPSEWMNSDEKLQLDEQMRMYVQLLTQAYLLSHGTPDLSFINISAKLFLDEIKMFASREIASDKKSAFYAHNLDNALNIINKSDKFKIAAKPLRDLPPSKTAPVPGFAKRIISSSKVFIYPELLPMFGFLDPLQSHLNRKSVFMSAEDNLIALGLEQFSSCESKVSKVEFIQSLLVPSKTFQQVKCRIKNCKAPKMSLDNPIKYYFVHKVAPQFPRVVRIFDPENVKVPTDFPFEVLPKWMKYYCQLAGTIPMLAPTPIAPSESPKPPVAIVRPMFRTPPKKRKSRLILPHGAIFSSLKQINPILKKYNFPKRPVAVLPFSICPLKDKCKKNSPKKPCHERSPVKPRTIKPKPVVESENEECVDSPDEKHNPDSPPASPINHHPQIVPVNIDNLVAISVVQPAQMSLNSIENLHSSTSYVSVCESQTVVSNEAIPTAQISHLGEGNEADFVLPAPVSSSAVLTNVVSEPSTEGNVREKSSPKRSIPKLVSEIETSSVSLANTDADEVLEEMPEDEHDSTVVTTAVTTVVKKQTVSKKKNRILRDLESSLALLKPSMVNNDPKKEEREIIYVNSFLLRAQECLKAEPETWNLFLLALCKHQFSTSLPVKLYLELKVILKNYPSLLDDFVAFLKPAEAEFVGKYKEYLTIYKIREFLRKVEVHFSNQPHHIPRIVRALSQFRQQSYVTSAEALSGLLPLLRNQTHLMEELSQLIPDAAPPLYLQTDFEDINVPNSDGEFSSNGSCENVTIPDTPDPYGGKECPCKCHTQSSDNRMLNKSRHCVKCGVKFIDGRIYLQTGKVLKPAQVTYLDLPPESNPIGRKFHTAISRIQLPQGAVQKLLATSETNSKQELVTAKKEGSKAVTIYPNPIVLNSNEVLPSGSKLPCDVIEDTVFPTIVNAPNKCAPSDFSHLRHMIDQSKENSSLPIQSESQAEIVAKRKWIAEEDKLIIYNCQRLGICKEAFISTAKALKTRTAVEVKERFFNMVEIISKETPKQ